MPFPVNWNGVGRTNAALSTDWTLWRDLPWAHPLQDRFKKSLIIILADHGRGYLYKDGKLLTAEDRFYGLKWSWARSRPLVLIKPAKADRTRDLVTDQRMADLFDIFPTVFANTGKPPQAPLAGNSLLAAPPTEREHFYHFYDKAHDHRFIDGTL